VARRGVGRQRHAGGDEKEAHAVAPFSLRGAWGALANSPAAARRLNLSIAAPERNGLPAMFINGSSHPSFCHLQMVQGVRPIWRAKLFTEVSGGASVNTSFNMMQH